MPDILIRDVPEEILAALEVQAKRLGLSRIEFLRRILKREASIRDVEVTREDLNRFASATADLADPEVMRGAWS